MSPVEFSEQETHFIIQAAHEYVKQQGLAGSAAATGLCVVAKLQAAMPTVPAEPVTGEGDGD